MWFFNDSKGGQPLDRGANRLVIQKNGEISTVIGAVHIGAFWDSCFRRRIVFGNMVFGAIAGYGIIYKAVLGAGRPDVVVHGCGSLRIEGGGRDGFVIGCKIFVMADCFLIFSLGNIRIIVDVPCLVTADIEDVRISVPSNFPYLSRFRENGNINVVKNGDFSIIRI